jgi:hypothetical protein
MTYSSVNFDRFMGPLLFPWHRRSGIVLSF